jgi:hypothetical protein
MLEAAVAIRDGGNLESSRCLTPEEILVVEEVLIVLNLLVLAVLVVPTVVLLHQLQIVDKYSAEEGWLAT